MTKEEIITDLIREDARKEALEILSLSTEIELEKFINNYENDKGNICCLILDSIKDRLVKENKMKQNSSDAFGGWMK